MMFMNESSTGVIVIRYSWWRAVGMLLLTPLWILMSIFFFMEGPPNMQDPGPRGYFGIVFAMCAIGMGWQGLSRMLCRSPRLVLDDEALTNYSERPQGRRIPWRTIRTVNFWDTDEGNPASLTLTFVDENGVATGTTMKLVGLDRRPSEIYYWVNRYVNAAMNECRLLPFSTEQPVSDLLWRKPGER